MDKRVRVLITIGILVGLALAFYFISYAITKFTGYSITGKAVYSKAEKIQLGRCLQDKGIILYCSALSLNCLRQKTGLGLVYNYISYIECSENFEACEDLSLPAWEIGKRFYYGIKDLEFLAQKSGCKVR